MSGPVPSVPELLAQSRSRPVQPVTNGPGGNAEHERGFVRLQSLPGRELDQLPVAGGQRRQCLPDHHDAGHIVGRIRDDRAQLLAEPLTEPFAALAAAMVVGEHPARHAVEPQPGGAVGRHIADAPPRDEHVSATTSEASSGDPTLRSAYPSNSRTCDSNSYRNRCSASDGALRDSPETLMQASCPAPAPTSQVNLRRFWPPGIT